MQAQPPQTNEVDAPDPARLSYIRGLDGLRALAVIAVLLYHAELGVHGGYLGVESFFVISGFLITALLHAEWQKLGRIRLRTFWLRRARRLLPALFVLLAGTLALAAILLPEELDALVRDTLAASVYATNWYLIASGQSYFDAVERPSLLRHLWSLAIEEQFYLVWPLLFAAGMRFLRARGTLILTLLAAIGSAALMAALYEPGADPSRVYYGTDTRATGLLLGAALALLWVPGREPGAERPGIGRALDGVGLLTLAGLIGAYAALSDQNPLLYRGGLALVSLATAVVIAAATHPQTRLLPWLLELRPLRWVGVRSYGIYLWHWPIFMVTRPGVDLPDTWQTQLLRFGLAFLLAAISYTLVELPIRQGALGRVWRSLRRAKPATDTAADTAPGQQTTPTKAPVRLYQRAAPVVATGLLALGVLVVTASVAQAAARNTLLESSGPPALAQITAAPAATEAPAAASAVASAQATAPAEQPTSTGAGQAAPSASATPADTFDPALAEQLQTVLDAAVEDGTIPGAVLSVKLPDDSTWTGTSGLADPTNGTAMTADTRVRVGSLSKMFTAVVVLQLVQEGAVELDAPISTWLPDLLPNADTITVRQLLQHTSGLYDYLEDRRLVAQAYDDPQRVWTPEELVGYSTEFPPSFEPGAEDSWDYSSTNYVILGMIVEQATGNTLSQELHGRIFEPLGLTSTYALPEDTVEGPQSRGYSRSDDQTDVSMSFTFGSANIVTTADDLRRFGEALFGGQLLEPATLETMEQFVDGKGQYDMPELAYGLGLMRNRLPVEEAIEGFEAPPEASQVVGHIGGFGGFRAALWYAPASETLVALNVNQASTDPNILATQVLAVLLNYEGSQ